MEYKGDFIVETNNDVYTVFEDSYLQSLKEARKKGIVDIKDIIKIIHLMQDNEMDCHVVIAGQNGVGKTYLLLAMMKQALGKYWINNLLLARHTTNDFIQFILTQKNTILGIDELNQYLWYKQHADLEQNHLIQQLELARSNRIGIIGCIRDARKLTVNYRQGKMSIVIWIIDRFVKGGSYAAVFVANPSIESYDKFGFSMIAGDIVNFNEVRQIFEDLPSFVGYLKIPHVSEILTKEELEVYKHEKQIAMAYAHINFLIKQYNGKKVDYDTVINEIKSLSSKLGEAEIAKLITQVPTKPKGRLSRAAEPEPEEE